MGRPLRTHLDMLKPDLNARVENKQLSQKISHDNKTKERSFEPDEEVYVRIAGPNSPGRIQTRRGSVQYEIMLEDGRLVIKHVDHIQSRKSSEDTNSTPTLFQDPEYELIDTSLDLDPVPQSTPTTDIPTTDPPPPTPNHPHRVSSGALPGFANHLNAMAIHFPSKGGGM